jgi:hypothetical protein
MSIDELIDELAAAQKDFEGSEFLAPVVPGSKVRVRIAGIVCELAVQGATEPGFMVLRSKDGKRAKVVRGASRREVKGYLALFPQMRLVLADPVDEQTWLALPALGGTQRVQVEGVVPVLLVEGAARFDTVLARCDGQRFWFEGRDRRRERAIADYLRAAFAERTEPSAVSKKKMSPAERQAYAFTWARDLERRKLTDEDRIREALAHGGGKLERFVVHGDRFQVTWTVDGRHYHSAVGKQDLAVMVAGICLAGQDRRFDLASLVGVMRERGARGAVRVGRDGMPVDEYFEVHPEDDE